MTFYRNLAPAIVSAGWEVTVLEGSGFGVFEAASPDILDGVRVECVTAAAAARWLKRFPQLAAAPMLRRVVAASWAAWERAEALGPFDVIEAVEFGLLHVPHALQPLAPTVVQCHAAWGQIGLHERKAGEEIDHALALALETEAMRHMSARHTYAEANAQWWMRETGVEFETIRPAWKLRSSAPAGDGVIDPKIRVFGRIQAWKGPRETAQAWREAPDLPDIDWHGRDVALDARGSSTNAALHAEFAEIWGKRIHPRAPVPPQEVARLQARSLLNLVPSTWDVFNFTAVEAMASARPVVCSNRAGASELIEDGRTGFVYDGMVPISLAETLRRALSMDATRLARIGTEGRSAALSILDPKRQADSYLNAYRAAILEPKRATDKPSSWFESVVVPRKSIATTVNSHFEQHSLRDLASHVFERSLRKAGISK